MKLVGASNWFIQAPFVLEAVVAGLIGAIIAYGTLVLAKIYVFDGALEPLTAVLTPVPWCNVHLMLPILAGGGCPGQLGHRLGRPALLHQGVATAARYP